MGHPAVTLKLPEDIYDRVRRAAKGMNQSLETALVNIVRAATPSRDKVPAEYRAELEAMEDLGDEELMSILRGRPVPSRQRRNRTTPREESARTPDRPRATSVGRARADGDRLTPRRSYAALLLKYRGHRVRISRKCRILVGPTHSKIE